MMALIIISLYYSEKEIRVEVARQREMKWLDMFKNWDKWIKHRFQKVFMSAICFIRFDQILEL